MENNAIEKTDSKYQVAIFDTYRDTKKNIFVSAGPGSGKSYTILKMVKMTPFFVKKLVSAFNKSVADELKNKVPMGTDVGTIHSIGYGVLRKNVYRRYKLNDIKTWVLAKKVVKNHFKDDKNGKKKYSAYLHSIANLYNLYRLNLAEASEASLMKLAIEYSVDFDDQLIGDTLKVIDYLNDYNLRSHDGDFMIDFTDMLWLPFTMVEAGSYPKYDVLFIDEVQDLNPLQREMLLRVIKKNGRFVAVGDERQAIYSFMGSNLKSFEKFKSMPNTEVLPLSVSYRCGSNIIEAANKIFPGLEAFGSNPKGIIRTGLISEIEADDMVICRNNLPLIELFLNLSGMGKKSQIVGRDFGKNLINLIDKVDDYTDFDRLLHGKATDLMSKGIQAPYSNKSFVDLKEKIDILRLLMKRYGYGLEETKSLLKTLFSDVKQDNIITLLTGHKSKGLESRRVFWLFPELIPSQYANTELEMYQEQCLKYVIITRAQEELIIIPQQELI